MSDISTSGIHTDRGAHEGETWYHRLIDNIPVGVYRVEKNGHFIMVNQKMAAMFGYDSPTHFLSSVESINRLYARPEERPAILQEIEAAGFVKGKEVEFVNTNGTPFWVKLDTTFSREGDRTIYEGLMEDITARKGLDDELRRNAERLEALIYALPVGIVIIDPGTYKIVDVNPKVVLMIGAPAHRIVGARCQDFICPTEAGKCPLIDRGKSVYNEEGGLKTADGDVLPVHKTVLPINIDDRDLLLECFVDISEHKQAERERLKKEKLKGVVEMAGAVCHELNQPLQTIMGNAELLMAAMAEDRPYGDKVETIRSQAARMGGITKKLMRITRYETMDYLDEKIIDIEKASD